VHNTFFSGRELILHDWDSTRNCVFTNNAVFGLSMGISLGGTGILGGNISDSAIAGFAVGSATADFQDGANRIFYPASGSVLIDKGLPSHSVPEDFLRRRRDSLPDVGAFEFFGSTSIPPGLKEGFKP
jgi:hypothetical protein